MHSLKIPFSGQILSLNQVFILTRASIKITNKNSAALIGNTSALLKSLSPAGKKLTPMLAISAQGNLFSVGLYLFGNNIFGRLFGAILLSSWAYIQPLAIYILLFGENLIFMSEYFLKKINKVFIITQEELITYLLLIIIFKIFLSLLLVTWAHFLSDESFSIYESWAKNQKNKRKIKKKEINPIKGAIKDLINPLFLFSILLMCLFFIYAKASISQILWQTMRPIAGGFIIFYILRVFPIENFIMKLKSKKYKEVLSEALRIIKS